MGVCRRVLSVPEFTRLRAIGVAVLFLIGGTGLVSPLASSPAGAANPAADLDQCANGGVGDADEQCRGGNWVNGNLGPSKAHYAEGESLPYRMVLSGLSTSGSHVLALEWDTTKGGKHALDYLSTYNRTETDAAPCSGVAGCDPAVFSTSPIPADAAMQARPDWGGSQIPGVFTLFGGTITAVSGYSSRGSWAGDSSTRISVTFSASVANPVLAWAGHIATRVDWGQIQSAVGISGSPYHMRLIALDGSGGNQDRSLSADAVIFPASVTVVKQATPEGNTPFAFTASGGLSPASFSLVDDGDPAAPADRLTFSGITTFGPYTFTEQAAPGWALSSLSCSGASGGTTTSLETRSATVELDEADTVTCTFGNTGQTTITVDKTASPATVAEPGGSVRFDVSVTNNSTSSAVTMSSLADSVYGTITIGPATGSGVTSTTCATPQTIAPGATYSCSFTGTVTGNAGYRETDVVTAGGTDALGHPVSGTDDAVVTVTDVQPAVVVEKSGTPSTVSEPGGDVTFSVTVTNPAGAVEPIWLSELSDDVYGDLDGRGDCDVTPAVRIAPGGRYQCSFVERVSGEAGTVHVNTVTGTARDDDGNAVSDSDRATVRVADVAPAITVAKSASAATVHVGDAVTYTYIVGNPGLEALRDVTVSDDRCNPVDYEGGDADADGRLDPSETWTFRCTATLATTTTNTAVARGEDNEGNEATATDQATVRVIDPRIAIDKTAGAGEVQAGQSVTYTYTVTNPGDAPLAGVTVTDDRCSPVVMQGGDADSDGALDPGETWIYACTATLADAGSVTNIGTATGRDEIGQAVSATDTATVAVKAPVVLGKVAGPETEVEALVITQPEPAPVAAQPAPAAQLPVTGAEALRAAAYGAGLAGIGLSLRRAARRRRTG